MTSKEAVHRLVDELPENELPEAERFLRALAIADPVERSLALAPLDDEPEDDDLDGLHEARAQAASGDFTSDQHLKL
jgi:hypothetical protein